MNTKIKLSGLNKDKKKGVQKKFDDALMNLGYVNNTEKKVSKKKKEVAKQY